jgi:hypothetical protein
MALTEADKLALREQHRQQNWQKIQTKIEERDGQCLSELSEYVDIKTKVWIHCNQGHAFQTSWINLRQGGWCPTCARSRTRMYTIVDLQNYARSQGGQCRSDKYTNVTALYDWECKRGHRFKATWWGIYEVWCPYGSEAPDPNARDKFFDGLTQSGYRAQKHNDNTS